MWPTFILFVLQYWNNKLSRPIMKRSIDFTRSSRLSLTRTSAETRFRLSAKRTSPFKSAGGRQFSRLLAAEVCASVVAMLDTPCSGVVWRVLATHYIRQFPLHFPSRASPCAITFQLESTTLRLLPHGPVNILRSLELQCSYILPWLTKQRFTMCLKLCNNYRSIKLKFVGRPLKKGLLKSF